MDKEVLDFFASNKVPVERIIQVGVSRHGLTAESIKSAAEQIFKDVQAGKVIPQIQLARAVFGLSKKMPESRLNDSDVSELKAAVSLIMKVLESLNLPWYIKLWRRIRNVSK